MQQKLGLEASVVSLRDNKRQTVVKEGLAIYHCYFFGRVDYFKKIVIQILPHKSVFGFSSNGYGSFLTR